MRTPIESSLFNDGPGDRTGCSARVEDGGCGNVARDERKFVQRTAAVEMHLAASLSLLSREE
jgi:hypothetical protein